MPQPTSYTRSYDFTDFQAQFSDQPLPASPLDSNLDAIGTSISQIINRLTLIQRDDGELKNQSVTLDSLSNTVTALLGSSIDPKGNWATATDYEVLDLVNQNGVTYICAIAHTSGTFATDRDAGKWILFSNPAADSSSAFYQKFSGTGAQVLFTLSDDLSTDENALMIFYDTGGSDGYQIVKPEDFTVNGTSLTFDTAPVLGTDNILVFSPTSILGAVAAAQAAAEAAQADAETAQAGAEAAQTAAETAQAAAESAQTGAETAETNAGTAQTAAEAAQTAAETAQAASEAVLVDAGFVAVATDLQGDNDIGTVAGLSTEVAALGARSVELAALGALTSEISALNALTTELAALGALASELAALGAITAEMVALEAVDAEIVALSALTTELGALGALTTELGALGALTTELSALYAIAADITTVAADVASVIICATNIEAIIAAAGGGNLPYTATAATGVSFAIGEVGRITSNGIEKTNATQESTASGTLVMAIEAISSGGTGDFYRIGEVTGLSGLTADTKYYLDTTDGAITTTPPTNDGNVVREIGIATSTTTIQFDPQPYTIVSNTATNEPVILEDSTSVGKASGATLTVPAPTDINDGDLLMVFISIDYTSTNGASNPITPPSGWTVYSAYERVNAGADGLGTIAYYKFALGEDGADYDFADADSRPAAAVLARISGADPNDPFDAQDEDSDTATEPVAPTITTNVDDTIAFTVACFDQNKTRQTPYEPTGYTLAEDLDGDADISLAYKAVASAAAVGTATWDISSGTRWKAWHFAIKKANASVSTGGGGGGSSTGVGPFPLEEDGLGYTIKWTFPINEAGSLSGAIDAWEVFCSNSPSYTAGKQDLITYSHPTYFIRTATAYRAAAPIRPAAYTSSNSNGPGRSEGRHERNYGPTERIRFKSTIRLIQAAANSKGTTVQIHRNPGSPVIKGNWLVDGAGTSWTFRALIKQADGAPDISFSDPDVTLAGSEVGSKGLAGSLSFDTDYTVEYDYDPVAGTLKVWWNTANTNTPTIEVANVSASGQPSYIKPGGVYPSFAGDGADSDLWITEITGFVLIDDSGNEVARP